MNRSSWKRAERAIAAILGGKRIPINGRKGPDVAHATLSVEVKSRTDLPDYLWAWLDQAADGAPEGRTPIVVLHRAGRAHREDDLVVLRLAHLVGMMEERCAENR